MLFRSISKIAVNIAATDWAMKRGSGGRFSLSSRKPRKPRISAGISNEDAANSSALDRPLKMSAPYVTTVVPMMIATPPRYGTGFSWVLWGWFGRSTISALSATLLISGVRNPTKKKVAMKRVRYCELEIIVRLRHPRSDRESEWLSRRLVLKVSKNRELDEG